MSSIGTTRRTINTFLIRFFGADPARLPKRQLTKHLPRAVFCPDGRLNEAFLPYVAQNLIEFFPQGGKTAEELVAELKRENLTGVLEGLGDVYKAMVREREKVLKLARQGSKLKRMKSRMLALQTLVNRLGLEPIENRKIATNCIREGLGFSGVRVYTLEMESGRWLHEHSEGEEGISNFEERSAPKPNSEKAFLTKLLRQEILQAEIDRAQGEGLFQWHLNGEWAFWHIPDRSRCAFVDREQLRKDEEGDAAQRRNGYGSGGAREILYLVFGGRDQKMIEVYMITNWKSKRPLFTDKREELDLLQSFAHAYAKARLHAEDHQKVVEDTVRDPLTGLHNRRYFDRKLPREMTRNLRQRRPVSLASVDFDDFKGINETYGHPFGDLVMKKVSEVMRKSVRMRIDAVCRVGGEEFEIILPELDEAEAVKVMDRVRDAVGRVEFEAKNLKTGETDKFKVTISCGISSYRPPENIDEIFKADDDKVEDFIDERTNALIARADRALLRAKAEGKNRVVRYQKPS